MNNIADEYYSLIESGADQETIAELDKQIELYQESFSDDPAYVAILKAARKGIKLV